MRYPIFILAKDDRSIRMHTSEKDLNLYEKIDIDNELYTGWDFDGYPFKVVSENIDIKLEKLSDQPQLDAMREAIFRYMDSTASYYRPDKPFFYEKTSNDYADLFEKLKLHIKNAPFKQKVINFLHRF